jgi:PAS domain S-box-containing protein
LGCGATHVMDVINIWQPYYYIDSFLRVITALASIGTAIMLVKITPQILLIPNPEEFKKLNEELKEQLQQLEEKEKQLREREALLLETQEIGNIGSYDLDIIDRTFQTTPQLLKIFGFEKAEKINVEKIMEVIHPEDRDRVGNAVKRTYESGLPLNVEYRIIRGDGSLRYVWSRAKVHYDQDNKPMRLVGSVLDLTEEKVAEEKLQAIQTELSQVKEFVFLAEALPQIVFTTDHKGNANYYNQNWNKYTGQTTEEALVKGWQPFIHPDDLQPSTEMWKRSLKEKSVYQIEYRIRRFDGAYRWFLGKAIPMKDNSGNVTKWVGTATDIDDLKTYEEVLLKNNIELTKTNKDLDNFVYTASHDLKAPIANLEGLLNLLKKKVSSKVEEDEGQLFSLMETSVNRFKNTIKELTEITKINREIREDVQLVFFSEVFEEIKDDLFSVIQEHEADIRTNFEVADIYFSKKNFRSVIYNLFSNALKYRSPYRKPKIEIRTFKAGNFVCFSIKDNGLGFDISKKDKVFSMFRRLHSHVEGTGIGLYMVKRIVENAGGSIEVESKIDEGTEFKVYFPF